MLKMRNKFIITLIVFNLLMVQLAPTIVLASNEIKSEITNQDNVKFNATIKGDYSAELNIEEEATLDLIVSVENAGYLKNAKVTIEGNNYAISKPSSKYVKAVKNNVIELNEIKIGEKAEINLPINAVKTNEVAVDYFSRNSTVTLTATYVNEKGKEKEVKKTLIQTVKWSAKTELVLSQKLVRYLKYDQNKTILSFEITDGVKDNILPALNKQLNIQVPNINNKQPSKVIVTANNVKYQYDEGVLKIQKENITQNEGIINWDSNNTYLVTYIYDGQTNNEKIIMNSQEKVTLANGIEQIIKSVDNEFEIKAQVGNIVAVETTSNKEISKGYMYTNLNRQENKINTPYSTIYNINIGYAELTDKIELIEESNIITTNKNESIDVTQNIFNNKIYAVKNEIIENLGENGSITVRNSEGIELGKLTKDNLTLQVNTNKVLFEINYPQKEGNIHIKIDKIIDGSATYTKEQIDSFESISSKITIKGYKEETEISKEEKTNTVDLKAPESKATLDVSAKSLSTVIENKDVVFNVVLAKKDINDALFTNPKFRIELPSQVKAVKVTASQILYDDEIKPESARINGTNLDVSLSGTQTKYETSSTTDGTLIRIVANLTLDELAPSSKEKIKLTYSNDATGEIKTIEKEIDIIAPSGFITTNTLNIDGKSVTTLQNQEESIKIESGSSAKQMDISAKIINNLGTDAKGAVVLGRLPFAGNKTLDGKSLSSTFNTTLITPVTVQGLNAIVYYSSNGDEIIDGNSWTTEFNANTKSFKIVANEDIINKSLVTFNYSVGVPENLPYEMNVKETYGIYYNNNATVGTAKNLIQAIPVGITTGAIPTLNVETVMVDTHDGHEITNNGNVTEGEFVTYRVKVNNTGNQTAINTKLLMVLPDGIELIEKLEKSSMQSYDNFIMDKTTKQITKEIGEINPKDTETIEINAKINKAVTSNGENSVLTTKIQAIAENTNDNPIKTFNVKNTKGNINLKLTSNASKSVEQWDEIDFYIELSKINSENKNNVKVNLYLPSEMDYVGTTFQSSYDQAKHILTIDYGTMDTQNDKLWIPTQVLESKTGNLNVIATVTCDEQNGPTRSNVVTINSISLKDVIKANQSTNVPNGRVTDNDRLELYTDIKNESNSTQVINYENTIQKDINVTNVKISVDGVIKYEGESNYIINSFMLPAGKTAKVTVSGLLTNDATGIISNIPTINVGNTQIEVNEIKLNIQNSQNEEEQNIQQTENQNEKESNENANNGQIQVSKDNETNNGIYSISGIVWFDKNNNGKRDSEEIKLEKVNMLLYDANTNQFAKDYNGKDIVTQTDELGAYSFENLNPGRYIVICVYDNSEYAIGAYQIEGVDKSENSDFIPATLSNEPVAATDAIKIENENAYNVDLGLKTKKEFDLSLNQVISKITVSNSKENPTIENYESSLAKIELSPRNIQNTTVLIEYKMTITNEGQLPGYATSIVDYIPEGMIFSSELNNEWYMSTDGNIYNTSLVNTVINPGETKEVRLVLIRRMNGENTGIVRNTAEIKSSYTEYGVEDIDSTSGNEQDGEDDISSTDTLILMNAGKEMATISGITVGILALTALAIYEIQKHIINKMYNYVS